MEEKNNLELYEEREREILEALGRMETSDPNRKNLIQELNTISTIRNNYDQTELTRLNNNARNDIEEAKLAVEEEKVKNDKNRAIATAVQSAVSIGVGTYLFHKSYHMDVKGYPFKDMKVYAMDLIKKAREIKFFGK